MKLNYINVVTNNSIWVINRLSNLLRKRNYSIEAFSASFDEKWNWNIIVWIELDEEKESIEQVISQIYKLFDVIEVVNMEDNPDQIKYIFNVNWNCKKTLKKISRTPDKIMETSKEWIYVYILDKEDRHCFVAELNNMRLPFVQRVVWMV